MKKLFTLLMLVALSSSAFAWSKVSVRGNWGSNPWMEASSLYNSYYSDEYQRNVWAGWINFSGDDVNANGGQFKFLFGEPDWRDFAPDGMQNLCVHNPGPYGNWHYIEIVDNKLSGDVIAYRLDWGQWQTAPYTR